MIEDKYADEMLTDEELDNVTGGTCEETAEVSFFLKTLGIIDEWYTAQDLRDSSGTEKEEKVKAGLEKLGIGVYFHGKLMGTGGNYYYHRGTSYTQKEVVALIHVMAEKLGVGIYSK